MKKVKIMLLAITVFAAVGGALAFKAKKQSFLYCTTGSGLCSDFRDNISLSPISTEDPIERNVRCTVDEDSNCPPTSIYAND